MKDRKRDLELGMRCSITRRDFLNGFGLAVGTSLIPLTGQLSLAEDIGRGQSFAPGITQQDPRYYPPPLTGLRGSHIGSFEVAHTLRDGKEWPEASEDQESY